MLLALIFHADKYYNRKPRIYNFCIKQSNAYYPKHREGKLHVILGQ